jgi:hypothetical protein
MMKHKGKTLIKEQVEKHIKKKIDTPPNSSRDPKVSPKGKQQKKKKVGAHFLTRNISGVGGCARDLRWD